MSSVYSVGTWALLAADEGPGRGDDPSSLGGILIVAGIAVGVLLLGLLALRLVVPALRRARVKPGPGQEETHDPGDVGRIQGGGR